MLRPRLRLRPRLELGGAPGEDKLDKRSSAALLAPRRGERALLVRLERVGALAAGGAPQDGRGELARRGLPAPCLETPARGLRARWLRVCTLARFFLFFLFLRFFLGAGDCRASSRP